MNGCKIVDYGVDGSSLYEVKWNDNYDWYDEIVYRWISPEQAKEGVLYIGGYSGLFVTRHNGKLICLKVDDSVDYSIDHQLNDLIESGLAPYDAFKVLCL